MVVRVRDGRHVEALAAESARVDLANRGDVEALLRRFYGQVLVDDILPEPFAEIRMNGLESHLPVMCDFWQTVLFRAGLYGRSAVRAHHPVHNRRALTARHFLRWLKLWNSTIDQMYHGPGRRARKSPSDQNRPRYAPRATG